MSTTAASHNNRSDVFNGRTIAQWFCLIAGATLVLVGLLGFIADATFDMDNGVQGDSFLGFEVNGWHNLVHIATGLFLLSGVKKAATAKTVALTFGLVYLLVTIIGLIDGNDVLTIFPVNGADNVLHAVLSLAAIAAALASRKDDAKDGHGHDRGNARTTTPRGEVGERRPTETGRFAAGEQVAPPQHDETTRPR